MYKANILALSLLMSGCGMTSQPRQMQQQPPQQEEVMVEEEVAVVADKNAVKGSNFRSVTSLEEFDKILAENNIVVVDFYAEWCGHCKPFAPIFEQASSSFPSIMFVKIDGGQAPAIIKKENIRGYPTVKAYKNGKVLNMYGGDRKKKSFHEFLSKLGA